LWIGAIEGVAAFGSVFNVNDDLLKDSAAKSLTGVGDGQSNILKVLQAVNPQMFEIVDDPGDLE